ncbi:MAG: hypothetical protein J6N55_06595 [Anaerovibrio sp.]|uniref:PBECR3 domain-containing polyvalent protein n=1 Tax=Anaerovibrio sp. TaxID=1872532 RepID=UPI001B1ED7F8|nr:PBECR2 nuclease fold domain-containing protein [Anaerovibrio sp.]MBO6245931.1 hypothetical protein [Anaerovibrio sp.]
MSTRQVGIIDDKTIQLLGLNIAPGTPILLGDSNIAHMKDTHPEDYEKYFSSLETILAAPDYVNLNPKDGSIKYIKTIDKHVVVGVRVSTKGKAFARTIFTIEEWKLKKYESAGYLKEHTKKA